MFYRLNSQEVAMLRTQYPEGAEAVMRVQRTPRVPTDAPIV